MSKLNRYFDAELSFETRMCAFVLRLLLFPSRGGKIRALSSECKIDQSDFTDLKSVLIQKTSVQTSKAIISMELLKRKKTIYV